MSLYIYIYVYISWLLSEHKRDILCKRGRRHAARALDGAPCVFSYVLCKSAQTHSKTFFTHRETENNAQSGAPAI